MSFALQDEPERGHRWVILGVGMVLASGLWGGGLFAANQYTPPKRPRRAPAVMTLIKVAPPKPPKVESAPEPPQLEPEIPKAAPVVKPPKPKPKPKLRKKPKNRKPAKPEPAKPQPTEPLPSTPTNAPPSRVPVQLGLSLSSTSSRGRGPAIQVGNHFGGQRGGRAKKPEIRRAPGGTTLKPGPVPAQVVKPVRVKAKVRKKFRPKYTKAALRAGTEGKVVIVVTIEPTGKVSKAVLIKGLGAGLDQVALKSVKRWLFRPATLDGQPVRSTKRITVDFMIES